MSSDDRKDPTSPAPGNTATRDGDVHPDAPADAREQAHAASFAALVDRLVSGQSLPPAMTSDERALIETAGMVRAAARPVELAAERQRALIDSVLGSVLGSVPGSGIRTGRDAAGTRGRAAVDAAAAPVASEPVPVTPDAPTDVTPDARGDVLDMGKARERRRARFLRVLPWSVAMASVAASLALVLWQARGRGLSRATPALVAATTAPAPDITHRSRPAGDLVGEIPRERADAARARIDMIYADRMIGYRDLRLRGGRL